MFLNVMYFTKRYNVDTATLFTFHFLNNNQGLKRYLLMNCNLSYLKKNWEIKSLKNKLIKKCIWELSILFNVSLHFSNITYYVKNARLIRYQYLIPQYFKFYNCSLFIFLFFFNMLKVMFHNLGFVKFQVKISLFNYRKWSINMSR